MPFRLKQLKLDEDGLSKVLGFLEANIMETLWDRGDRSVRDVRDSLKGKKPYSFNTIMTVMNRLVEKKLLAKRTVGGAFVYRTLVTRDSFMHDVTKSIVRALVRDGSLFQVAAFVEAINECSEDDRKLLKKIVDGDA